MKKHGDFYCLYCGAFIQDGISGCNHYPIQIDKERFAKWEKASKESLPEIFEKLFGIANKKKKE